ncbi:tumor protein p53-inducible protein 13 isoform X2 [Erythrolamprus reginae]|uniref:tumor protein p53-inducible protein 13 isoform X2 n=1 Tax=Erythrolamprus reginae TaxID=121349 RepID=UPI00396CDA55
MGEPPGAPVLLLVLSLAGGGGGQENKAAFVRQESLPDQNLPADSGSKGNIGAALGELKDQRLQEWLTQLKKLPHLWKRLPTAQELWAHGRQRRAVFLPRPAASGTKGLATKGSRAQEHQSHLALAQPTFREEKDSGKAADVARRTLPNHPDGASVMPGHPRATKQGMLLPNAAMEVIGAAHTPGCQCPDSQRATVVAQEMEARQGGLHVPTPRTEEAVWAASALTFLLIVLTLAVLYTRLHQKCRRGPSLYWMTSSEEGRETVAAVMKRRLFSRSRRTKRPRHPPRLLRSSSSSHEDSST